MFDHPVADPAWHLAVDAPHLEPSPERVAKLIADTFEQGASLLQPFSDAQLKSGVLFC